MGWMPYMIHLIQVFVHLKGLPLKLSLGKLFFCQKRIIFFCQCPAETDVFACRQNCSTKFALLTQTLKNRRHDNPSAVSYCYYLRRTLGIVVLGWNNCATVWFFIWKLRFFFQLATFKRNSKDNSPVHLDIFRQLAIESCFRRIARTTISSWFHSWYWTSAMELPQLRILYMVCGQVDSKFWFLFFKVPVIKDGFGHFFSKFEQKFFQICTWSQLPSINNPKSGFKKFPVYTRPVFTIRLLKKNLRDCKKQWNFSNLYLQTTQFFRWEVFRLHEKLFYSAFLRIAQTRKTGFQTRNKLVKPGNHIMVCS